MKDIYNRTKEATVSNDIAYARGEIGRSTHVIPLKKKKKKKWDKEDWYVTRYKKKHEAMMEALPAELEATKNAIVNKLESIINASKLTVHDFVDTFRSTSDTTPGSCLIRATKYAADMHEFRKRLPEDLGELELILTALDEGKSLDKYAEFSRFKHLYGARIVTRQEGFTIVYEGTMSFNYIEKENLRISDLYIVEELKNRSGLVSISKRMVYPKEIIFDGAVYVTILNIIQEGI